MQRVNKHLVRESICKAHLFPCDNNTEEELGWQNIITQMNNPINEMVIQNQQIYDVDNDDENSFNNSDDAHDSIS